MSSPGISVIQTGRMSKNWDNEGKELPAGRAGSGRAIS
jgi:hypothetical protein